MNKKELKIQVKETFLEDQKLNKEFKEKISKLPKEQKKLEKKKYKSEKERIKKERKLAIKAMSKEEKKLAKKHDKLYKKLKNRPKKYTVLALLAVVLVFAVINLAPIINDISTLMSIELTTDTPEAHDALLNGEVVAEKIADEGIVLLKNDDDLLPLKDQTLNVFGLSAMNFRLGGGGSGGSDQSRAVSLFDGLEKAGISYNNDLFDFYSVMNEEVGKEKSTGLGQVLDMFLGKEAFNEPSIDYLTDEIINEAKGYSSNALIVISSLSVEAADAELSDLKLSENEEALINKVTSNFDNVIIIVNAGNTLELGFLEEYSSIKSALWVGTPGSKGAISLGKILSGQVNPSGRLTDTYVYDVSSHPSTVNFGDYDYENIDGMSFLNYEESIYVGYRFFETYYKDDEAGYKSTVQFPFGYGLSYTEFDWQVEGFNFNNDIVTVDVKVTNTGEYPGKEVVQAYFEPPYSKGGIEKSAIELGAYEKTSIINPGQNEVVTLNFPIRDMASYDMFNEKAYVLEEGIYNIYISKNVHEHVSTLTYDNLSEIVYTTDEVTATSITNQFDYANGDLTYLSRNDFDSTYPNIDDMLFDAPQDVVDKFYTRPLKEEGTAPLTGVNNNILLSDLKGLDFNDPKWDDYLDQFTVDQMNVLINNGAYKTLVIEELGLPSTLLLDGPAGINFFFKSNTTAAYPTEILIASTWNNDLAYEMGKAVGIEANAYGVNGWYAPGMNIHRSPLGGRNYEYFSEDPLLSGIMSANMVKGAQSEDIIVFMKHFALNEQEVNARTGVLVWANEQAIREIYLRPFEITVKEANVSGVMSSFIHIGHKWSGGNPELLKNVLRQEWGFEGVVTTDAVLGSFMDLNLAIRAGNDLMLSMLPSSNEKYFEELYKEDPVGITKHARDRVHNICYAIVNNTNLLD